ncbi:DUF5602 domain-containing protein [Rhodococcus sp. NPDC058514]|uniref:DUF5602 domain-containing protein n=1 Tax=unclassified Rhodococcus (in: high G+C Gram-positive bacteria) TaxID=192944 RepID=UPI003659FCC7
MRPHRPLLRAGLIIACATLTMAGGTRAPADGPTTVDAGTFDGPTVRMGDGTARAFVTLDAAGNPTEVGMRLSEAAINGLPTSHDGVTTFELDLPEQASATVFDHTTLDWNDHGHGPSGMFDKPHFDMHFYLADRAEVAEIDPARPDFEAKGARLPDPRHLPPDYIPLLGPKLVPQASPAMGVHWIDVTDGLIPGPYQFTQAFLNGTWDGEYTFMEPMVTREWLLTKPSTVRNIKQPQAYQRGGYHPTTFAVSFDDTVDEYVITMGGMVARQPS